MAEPGAKTAAGNTEAGVYRVSIQAVCRDAKTAGRFLGAALSQVNEQVIDLQQHAVFDTAHPAAAKRP